MLSDPLLQPPFVRVAKLCGQSERGRVLDRVPGMHCQEPEALLVRAIRLVPIEGSFGRRYRLPGNPLDSPVMLSVKNRGSDLPDERRELPLLGLAKDLLILPPRISNVE